MKQKKIKSKDIGIEFHKLGRLVILNNELYLLSEKRYNQLFRTGIPKVLKIMSEKYRATEHQKLCDKVRKYGKLMGEADRMLRDD